MVLLLLSHRPANRPRAARSLLAVLAEIVETAATTADDAGATGEDGMTGHTHRLDELDLLEKKLVEMHDSSACWSDPLAEAINFVRERREKIQKDRGTVNPMYPKGSSAYAE